MRVREAATIDCYAELGVSATASRAEITAAFRSLVKELHPDSGTTDDGTAERLARVTASYRTLTAPDLRARYDETRRRAPATAGATTPRAASSTRAKQRSHEFLTAKRAKWFAWSGAIFIVAGIAAAVFVVSLHARDADVRAHGRPVVATAISRGDGIGLAFHTDAGKRVIAPEPRKSGIGDPSIGDRVRIRYDPRHPTDVVLDVDSTARDITLWIVALKLLLGGAVLLVAGLWRLRRARHATGG